MQIPEHTLTSFLPALLARTVTVGQPALEPSRTETAEVAVLGIDLTDSTTMTEDIATRGPDGPEHLAGVLNRVFATLADAIVAEGGSVVALAGDEIFGLWLASEHGGLAGAAQRAALAGLSARSGAQALPAAGGHEIRTRTGLGAGTAYLLDIGRAHGRRLFVAAGPAFQEMAAVQHGVAPGEIGLGASLGPLLEARAQIDGDGHDVRRLRAIGGDAPPAGVVAAGTAIEVPDALAARYLPDSVFHGLRRGGLRAELSPLTVLFVTLRTGPWSMDTCVQVNGAALHVLASLETYDGTLVSARQDADGVTLLAAFGLPPLVREHEAARAALCGLEISGGLKGYMEHGIGIATGHAFCGVFGSEAYRQYTVVGPIVNLGARLMQQAQNEVLCDGVTQRLSQERLRFSARGPTRAKGIRGPVEVYRPEWHEADPGLPALKRLAQRRRDVVTRGRERERQELAGRLVALSLGTSTAVVVEGDPGSGKTHLALDLLGASAGYGRILELVGSGDEMDRRPYHAWRSVLTQALGLSGVRDAAERAAAVRERLARWPDLVDWVPLLDDLLDLRVDGSALRDMTGTARRENTIRLVVRLLSDAAADMPLLLVLDDCHWLDSASWELLRALHRELAPLMLVLLTRPLAPAGPPDEGALDTASEVTGHLRDQGALWLRLGPLPADATEQIARDFLAVTSLDAPLRSLFREKVDGSPLFAVELAFQLRADEVLAVADGPQGASAKLAVPAADLSALRLPVRVEEVFRARLGALTEHQRAVLRAASVVGSTFDRERVLAADPTLEERSVATDLEALAYLNIVEADHDGWRFQHALVRDVALQSSLPSELRQRHHALATWYERHRLQPEHYALLAWHWGAAGEVARQVEYLEAAGTTALVNGAEEEAVALVRSALDIDERHPGELDRVTVERRAFWHSQIGEALAAQNRLDEATGSFTTALGLLGRNVPRSGPGWALRLVWEVLRQIVHLLRPGGARPSGGRAGEASAQAAEVFGLLAETQYFRSDSLAWTASNLAAVNLAEAAGDVGLAGRGYSGLANLAGTMRLHALARRYFRRSREEAATSRHGTSSPLTLGVMPDLGWEHDITATLSEAVYLRTMNRATDVQDSLDDVVSRLRDAGLNQPLEIALAIRGFVHSVAGTLHAARADFEDLVASAARRANADHLTWGLTLLVPVLLDLERTDDALRLDAQATGVYSDGDHLSGPNYHGSHARALVAAGALQDALEHARRTLSGRRPIPVFFHLGGLTAMAEACLAVMAAAPGKAERAAAERTTRRALGWLRRYARLYPFARGRHDLLAGRYLALRGREAAARRRWGRGLRLAEAAGLRLDAERIRRHLGGAAASVEASLHP